MSSAFTPGGGGFTDWEQLIGESVLLRQRLNQLDPDVNPYTIPKVGASEAAIGATERTNGIEVDAVHRQLLTYANGWDSFFVFAHLLPVQELGAGPRWSAAAKLLDTFYADGPPPEGLPPRDEVFCVAANPDEVEDLFVLWRTGPLTDGGHAVSWLAGEEVQRFPNMHELLLSVNEYLRRKLAKLQY